MGLFSGISRLFRKGAKTAGSLFKKGVRGIGSLASKGFYEGVEEIPRLASLAGGAAGTALGEGGAILLGQPELLPEAGFIGGRLGSQLGTELGKQIRTQIKKPVTRPVNRLGGDSRTFTPSRSNPNENVDRGVPLQFMKTKPRNELERAKQKKEMNEMNKMRFL
jgi:hypothetical protein